MSLCFCGLVFTSRADATEPFTPTTKGKKVIAYGADWPNTAYLRQHVHQIERLPFNGLVIGVSKSREAEINKTTLGILCFSRERYTPDDYQHAIDDLKATKFERFTDNFVQVETLPGDIDWFDAEWDSILHNIKILARVARQGGCVGIEFDPEEYSGEHIWTYTAWPEEKRKAHSEAEYIVKARERGEQFIRAINSEFPAVKILCLLGPSFTTSHLVTGSHKYRLLAPFIEGMCLGADDGTQIIDGYENSYPYRVAGAFTRARRDVLAAREIFDDKSAFDKHIKVGMGMSLVMDGNFADTWGDKVRPTYDYEMPFAQTAVFNALSYSDEYVWTWKGNDNGWELGLPYESALREGRERPAKLPIERFDFSHPFIALAPHAQRIKGHDDDTFTDLLKHNTLLRDLKTGWRFRLDPEEKGQSEKWFASNANDSDWTPINVGEFWEEQGFFYDGAGWYRVHCSIPQLSSDKKLILSIGAADESATVFFNGEQVANHDIGEAGWDKRIDVDLTGKTKPGENVIAIRVYDRTGPGGIWNSVKLFLAR